MIKFLDFEDDISKVEKQIFDLDSNSINFINEKDKLIKIKNTLLKKIYLI